MTESAHPISFFFSFFFFPALSISSHLSTKSAVNYLFIFAPRSPRSGPPLKRRLLKCFYYPVVSRALYLFIFFYFFYHLALINNVCNLQRFRKDTQQQQRGETNTRGIVKPVNIAPSGAATRVDFFFFLLVSL